MPFKSKKQERLFYAVANSKANRPPKKGLSKSTAKKFIKHSKKGKY